MKVEFSDIYKFIVSLGIVLIGLAFVLPWLIIREPFEINTTTAQLENLTYLGQEIVLFRQTLGFLLGFIIPGISIFLIFFGVLVIIFGLWKWWARQSILDRRELAKTEQEELKLRQMSPKEKEAERKADIVEPLDVAVQGNISWQDSAAEQEHVGVEKLVEDLIYNCFPQNHCNILTDRIIGNAYFDFIIQFRNKKSADLVIEVKYARKGYRSGWVTEATTRVLLSIDIYKAALNRPARGIVLFISPELPHNVSFYQGLIKNDERFRKGNIFTQFLQESDLKNNSCDRFLRLFYPEENFSW